MTSRDADRTSGTGGPFDLTGRLALVTGSSRGIGNGIARGYARAGAHVILNGLDPDRLEKAAREIAGGHRAGIDRPGSALPTVGARPTVGTSAFDVTDPAGVDRAVDTIVADHGCPDILVNNAGVQLRGPLVELNVNDWRRVLDVDLTSAFLVGRAVARHMLARGSGKIINICSVQNRLVRASTGAYAAAKSGLEGLTRSMCVEWASAGLQVNGLAPGYLATDLNHELVNDEGFSRWITGRTPAARWGTVADVVGPAIWLASSASDFVNGQVIFVDGGLTAVI